MKLKIYLSIVYTLLSLSLFSQNNYNDLPLAEKIRVKEGHSSFFSNLRGTNPTIQTTGPEQDCNSAIPVCQNVYTTSTSYSGVGANDEIPSNSCLGSNEKNSVWYTFSTSSAGNLAFNINPNSSNDDYDFALYDITGNNCSGISSGAITPIRCNFSATSGSTGLSSAGSNASEPASGINHSTVLATTPGKTYVLIISNYSSSQSGYTLDFSPGTASIFDVTPPTISGVTAPCGSNTIVFNASEQIKCNTIASNGSDFTITGPGGPYVVTAASGQNCGSNTAQINLTISPALSGAGPWTVGVNTGSDGNTLLDACGNAMASQTKTFTTVPPAVTITGPTSVCKGVVFALTASSASSYTWSGAAVPGGQQNQQTISVTPNAAGTLNFNLTVTNGICGNSSASQAVTVKDGPTAHYTASSHTICAGTPVTFTTTSTIPCTIGGSGAIVCTCGSFGCGTTPQNNLNVIHTWGFSDPFSGTNNFGIGNTISHTFNTPGTYYVNLNTNFIIGGGCNTSETQTFVVLPATPNLTVSPSVTICPSQSTTLTVSGGSSYTWTPNTSLSSTSNSVTVANPASTITYSVSAPGCSGNQTATVQVVVGGTPPAIGAISGPNPVCSNSSGNTYSVTNVSGVNYTWSVPSGASITSTPTNSNAITVNFGASAGTISVSAVGSCGTATASINVTLNPALNLTVTPSSSNICPGSSATLTASGATSYTWSPSASLNTSNGANVVASPVTNTTYTVLGSTGTCTGSTTAVVNMGGSLTLSVTPNSSTVCAGSSTTLTASGATNYTWSPSGSLNTSNGVSVIASPLSNTTYTVIGATGTCTGSATASITMGAALTLTLTSNTPTVCPGNSALLHAAGATTYTWSNASTLNTPNGDDVTATPLTSTTYTVMGSTGTCTGVATISVGIGACVSSSCNLSAIRTALTNAGNIELLGMNNTCSLYFINPQYMTGPQAQAYAQTFGANLISVQSASENTDLVQALSNQGFSSNVIWIGFSDAITEGSFVWYDGSPISYTNWAAGEPNNAGGNENCTQIYTDGSWNDLNCSGYNSMSVIEVNLCPQVSVSTPTVHCPGTNVTLNASTLLGSPSYTYTWIQAGTETFTNTSAPGNTDQITVTSLANNTFTVFSEDRYSCPQYATVTLSVLPSPTVTVNSPTICLGQQTATLTANGANTYTWTPGLSSTNGAVVTGNPVSSQNYTVTGTDLNGCISGTITSITVNPLPTVTVNSSTICVGQQTATLTAHGAATYSWSPGLSSTTGSVVTGNPMSTQTYTVGGIDLNGCINGTVTSIAVSPLPTITVNSSTICIGQQTATLTANGAATYSWSPGLSSTTGSVVTGNPTSTQTYTVGGIDLNGCINGTVTTIAVNPLPTITVNSSTICIGQQTATLTANGAATYSWSPGLSSTTGSVVTGNPTSTQTYTVGGIDLNGCINGTVTSIAVNPLPVMVVSPDMTVCPLAATTLTANGAMSYTWSPNIYLNNNTSSSVICTPSVTTTYTIEGLSAAACSNTVTMTIAAINTVVVNATASNYTICPLGSTTLMASGATTYTWVPALTLNPSNGGTVTASPSTSTNYTVTGASSTCTNSFEIVVTVTINPVINVTPTPSVICSGSTSNLAASGASSYTWSPATSLSAANGSNVVANPNVTTVYNISGTSPLGCIGTSTTEVVVIPTPTLAALSNPATICAGNSSTLSAFGATSYNWSPSGSSGSPVVVSPALTTTYTVTGTNGTAPDLCTSTKTIEIVVVPNPTLSPSPSNIICEGQPTPIYATGANTYTWSPSAGVNNINAASTNVTPPLPGVYVYTVTGTTNNCKGTATVEITVVPLPIVDAGRDTTINIDNTITLFGTGSGYSQLGFTSASDGTPLTCNYCPTVTVNPQESTCYTLEALSPILGCKNTDEICVTVTKDWDVFIPNAFTPNGDINNEIFIPMGYGISKIELLIFDRWGAQIFKSHDETIGWDGTNKGKLCQQDVYIYQAEITAMSGQKVKKTGHVTLLSKVK
ncbi:MAG: gliding motility-associated C-terminal domain-containing protein [Bacteroidetes bacterium]|nr:gliding motility-associated C-terminal domain-containing protein [Bacteroidota bacterium]